MNSSTFYYSIPVQQHQQSQSTSTQWVYQPSFYNGYTTSAPLVVTYPAPIVDSYHAPLPSPLPRQQQQQQHIFHQHAQPAAVSSSFTPQMRSYSLFRNPFSSSHHQSNQNDDGGFLIHDQQLNRNLAEHGITRLFVKGDGNCLFYALAEGLAYEMKVDPNEFGIHLRMLLRLPTHFRIVDFADRLRQVCVDQWRTNEEFYSQFVDKRKVSFLKEVKKFSKNGVSESTLGDIVPLTIANTLNVNITIFTSVPDLPRLDVKPENTDTPLLSSSSTSLTSRKTIYLAYNQYGLGHYDAAYPQT